MTDLEGTNEVCRIFVTGFAVSILDIAISMNMDLLLIAIPGTHSNEPSL